MRNGRFRFRRRSFPGFCADAESRKAFRSPTTWVIGAV
jgi:hypothetical protein